MDIFNALAEPTRREIIETLANNGQMSATAIAHKFQSSPPAISQHLKILRESGLLVVEKRAQQRIYHINPKKMHELENWVKKMAEHWNQRFDRLEKNLEEEKVKILSSYNSPLTKKSAKRWPRIRRGEAGGTGE